jgi:hypothetical protein
LRKRVKSSSRVDLVAPRPGVRRAVRRPGYRVRRVVSSLAVTRRWTWASLRARVSRFGREDVGEVDERASRGGDADAVVDGGLGVRGAVDVDAGAAVLARRRHLRCCWPAGDDPPQRRRGAVAEHRVRAAGQHRRDRRGER